MPRSHRVFVGMILGVFIAASYALTTPFGTEASPGLQPVKELSINLALPLRLENTKIPLVTTTPLERPNPLVTTATVDAYKCTTSPQLPGIRGITSIAGCRIHVQRNLWPAGAGVGSEADILSSEFREGWSEVIMTMRGQSTELCLVSASALRGDLALKSKCETPLAVLSYSPDNEQLQSISSQTVIE